MKAPRTLNLLVAAAGLVSLTGCSTDTLTDSAFWSYLPFTSSPGGHGSGGQSKDAKAPANAPKDQAETAATTAKPASNQPATSADSEGWNEPASKAKGAPAPSDKPTTPSATAKAPSTKPDASAPALPSLAGPAPTPRTGETLGLPAPGEAPPKTNRTEQANLGDPKAPTRNNREGSVSPSLNTGTDLPPKGPRAPVRLPEMLVDGLSPATIGRPTLTELPKRPATAKPSSGLTLPDVVTGETPDPATPQPNRLPRALTEAAARTTPPQASLALPGLPSDAPATASPQTVGATTPNGPKATPQATGTSPKLTLPSAPAAKGQSSSTLSAGSVPNGPIGPKANGPNTPLPDVAAGAPLPPKPIPAPFRLSEWISNDALHQEWRRLQLQRTQTEPAVRGGEQQRLRLVLDQFLLREKPSATDNK